MANVDLFLKPVVKEAAMLLDLKVQDGFDEKNPYLLYAAKAALASAQNFVCRPIIKGTHVDILQDIDKGDTILDLRVTPVQEVTEVLFNDEPLVLDEDYKVLRNRIKFLFIPAEHNFVRGIDSDNDFCELRITYIGGLSNPEKDNKIYSGLLTQTLANFKRKPVLGLNQRTLAENKGTVVNSSDGGELLKQVKELLAGYKYYGVSYGED